MNSLSKDIKIAAILGSIRSENITVKALHFVLDEVKKHSGEWLAHGKL